METAAVETISGCPTRTRCSRRSSRCSAQTGSRVRCADGKERTARIPGRMQKRVWIREDDIVLVEPWGLARREGRHRVALREERGRTAPGGRPPPVNRVRRALAILSPNGPEQTYAPARDDDGRRDVRTRGPLADRGIAIDHVQAKERALRVSGVGSVRVRRTLTTSSTASTPASSTPRDLWRASWSTHGCRSRG